MVKTLLSWSWYSIWFQLCLLNLTFSWTRCKLASQTLKPTVHFWVILNGLESVDKFEERRQNLENESAIFSGKKEIPQGKFVESHLSSSISFHLSSSSSLFIYLFLLIYIWYLKRERIILLFNSLWILLLITEEID